MSQGEEGKTGNICKQITSVATWGSYPTGSSRTRYGTCLRAGLRAGSHAPFPVRCGWMDAPGHWFCFLEN